MAPLSFMPPVSENLWAWSLYPGLQQARRGERERGEGEGGSKVEREKGGQIMEVVRRARRRGKLGERLVVSDSSNRSSGSNTCARAGPGGVYINTYKRRVNPGATPVPRILEVRVCVRLNARPWEGPTTVASPGSDNRRIYDSKLHLRAGTFLGYRIFEESRQNVKIAAVRTHGEPDQGWEVSGWLAILGKNRQMSCRSEPASFWLLHIFVVYI